MIIAATGHRPSKLIDGYSAPTFARLRGLARGYLRKSEATQAISGMALGWDQAFAEAARDLDLPLVASVPFIGQEAMWPEEAQRHYRAILDKAARVEIVCDGGYAPWKMQRRNEHMCDLATRICALWDGSPGGTANCIKYALKVGKPVDNLWGDWSTLA